MAESNRRQFGVSEARALADVDMVRIFNVKTSSAFLIEKTRETIGGTHDLLAEIDKILSRR